MSKLRAMFSEVSVTLTLDFGLSASATKAADTVIAFGNAADARKFAFEDIATTPIVKGHRLRI